MKYIVAAVCSLICSFTFGQEVLSYQPFNRDAAVQKQIIESIDYRYQSDIKAINGKKHNKEIAAIFKQRVTSIKEMVSEKEIITDPLVTAYLDALVQVILKGNPQLNKQPLRILFTRTYLPNAASMGEGTIVFHIGLFNRLDNEAQAAFILCHELAHYYLDHGNTAIYRYVEMVNSPDYQQQLKQIQKSEYNRNSQAEKLALDVAFNFRRHSREHEKAADSMALELMKNTPFDVQQSVTSLALLDSVDKDKYAGGLALEKQFNFAAYPFKKRWTSNNSLTFAETREETEKKTTLEDSLKTHPDCKLRISYLQKKINSSNGGRAFVVSEQQFKKLKRAFDYEMLEYCIETDKVARGLYFTLQMLSSDPQNAYLLGMAGRCFNKIYTAQKEHTLSKITDLPNANFGQEYNTLLKALQNWRLAEVAAINYYFLQTHTEAGKANEDFVFALIKSKEYFDKPEEKKEWINYYYQNFPKRKYNF